MVNTPMADPSRRRGAHFGEELPAGAAPVTPDDVLEMHEFLARFQGDMGGLFGSGSQRTDGAQGR